jgi:peptidylprolyl isomerase
MKRSKKDVPVAQRFTAFLVFTLVDGAASPAPTSEPICRLEFDICAGEKCPKATENFRQLVSGSVTVGEKRNSRQATYKGTAVLRTTNDIVQLGDTANSADGKTQDTIYGALIDDEACGVVPHRFGTLTLCNSGKNTNGSQFAIIANDDVPALPHLDKSYVSLGYLRAARRRERGCSGCTRCAADL